MNAPALIRESRDHRHLRKAAHELRDAMSEVGELVGLLHHGDIADLDRPALVATLRTFESLLLQWREACATLGGVPESEGVEDGESFESVLIGRFESFFTVSDVGERLLATQRVDCGRRM